MTVSTRRTLPLSYILIQLNFARCLTLHPGTRLPARSFSPWSVTTSPLYWAHQLPAEEAHHFFGAEVERAVLEQSGHQVLEVFARAEEDIRRILGMRCHPIVFHRPQQLAEQWIDPLGVAPEHPDPVDALELVGDLLRARDVAQAREGVVDLEVLDPAPVELARQPLVTVEIDLHLEREPGLQLDVDEPQLAIHEVVIELQTLSPGRLDE